MWIVLPRQPRPLARVWTGRVALAMLDALAWPAAWVFFVVQLTANGWLVGRMSVAVALLIAARRLHTAAFHNERYDFLIWRLWCLGWPLLGLAIALRAAFWFMR